MTTLPGQSPAIRQEAIIPLVAVENQRETVEKAEGCVETLGNLWGKIRRKIRILTGRNGGDGGDRGDGGDGGDGGDRVNITYYPFPSSNPHATE